MALDIVRNSHRHSGLRRPADAANLSASLRARDPATNIMLESASAESNSVTELDQAPSRLTSRELSVAARFDDFCGEKARVNDMRRWYCAGKRTFDVTVSSIALILVSPLLGLIAVLIRIDSPGPALFVQKRIGQRGRVFGMLKFRTMVQSSEELFIGDVHKHRDDPRLTRIGRLLRATSIDELPQLLNVLRGDMSLVGPRPEIVEIALTHYQPWQYQRLLVPQGMTGWWQVTGRGAKLLRENSEDDLYYVERASFWFDLKILFLTVRAVLRKEGAF